MTQKTYDILFVVTEYLKNDNFGICFDTHIHDLIPSTDSDFVLDGAWLFYKSDKNNIFYYTGVPCDKMITIAPTEFCYLYNLQ